MGRFNIDSFHTRRSSLVPAEIPSLNKVPEELKPGALKAWSANARERKIVCGHSSRHGSNGTSGMPKVLLSTPVSV